MFKAERCFPGRAVGRQQDPAAKTTVRTNWAKRFIVSLMKDSVPGVPGASASH